MKTMSKKDKIVFEVVFAFFVIYAAMLLYPFYFSFSSSLKLNGRAFIDDSISFPFPMHFGNYLRALNELSINENSFLMMVFNSIWYAAGSTVLQILTSCATAYVVSRYKFKLRGFFYGLAVFIMIVPIYGSLPSAYRLFTQLNLTNSRLYILSATSGFRFSFIILHAYFKGISWNYAEAAFVDGAGHFKVFARIMLPMAMPAATAISIMTFIGTWNDYQTPLLFMDKLPTLSSGLWLYERKIQYAANQPVYFAGMLISLIPVVTIFILFQNTIMQNVYTGGLKG